MLEQKQKGLHCALDFCCELDSKLYQIGTVFEPRLVIDHFLVFFEVVAVHLGNPDILSSTFICLWGGFRFLIF
jgi:hypothetical protein